MSGILTKELVEKAYELVRPQIESVLETRAKRQHLAVVVTTTNAVIASDPAKTFRENCLFATGIGDQDAWEHKYFDVAYSKAEKSTRTGKGSAELAPHYLREGDTIYWGSVVMDGIVVACSGVEPFYDEMFSAWIAAAIIALCKKKFKELPDEVEFIQ